jgi:hypothetical protein
LRFCKPVLAKARFGNEVEQTRATGKAIAGAKRLQRFHRFSSGKAKVAASSKSQESVKRVRGYREQDLGRERTETARLDTRRQTVQSGTLQRTMGARRNTPKCISCLVVTCRLTCARPCVSSGFTSHSSVSSRVWCLLTAGTSSTQHQRLHWSSTLGSQCAAPNASQRRDPSDRDLGGNLSRPRWRIFSLRLKRPDDGMLPIRASRGALEEKLQLKRSSASSVWGQLHLSPALDLLDYHQRR